MEREANDGMESVGPFRMRVTVGAQTPDSADRWNRRVEVLAAWLMSQWREEMGKEASQDGSDRV